MVKLDKQLIQDFAPLVPEAPGRPPQRSPAWHKVRQERLRRLENMEAPMRPRRQFAAPTFNRKVNAPSQGVGKQADVALIKALDTLRQQDEDAPYSAKTLTAFTLLVNAINEDRRSDDPPPRNSDTVPPPGFLDAGHRFRVAQSFAKDGLHKLVRTLANAVSRLRAKSTQIPGHAAPVRRHAVDRNSIVTHSREGGAGAQAAEPETSVLAVQQVAGLAALACSSPITSLRKFLLQHHLVEHTVTLLGLLPFREEPRAASPLFRLLTSLMSWRLPPGVTTPYTQLAPLSLPEKPTVVKTKTQKKQPGPVLSECGLSCVEVAEHLCSRTQFWALFHALAPNWVFRPELLDDENSPLNRAAHKSLPDISPAERQLQRAAAKLAHDKVVRAELHTTESPLRVLEECVRTVCRLNPRGLAAAVEQHTALGAALALHERLAGIFPDLAPRTLALLWCIFWANPAACSWAQISTIRNIVRTAADKRRKPVESVVLSLAHHALGQMNTVVQAFGGAGGHAKKSRALAAQTRRSALQPERLLNSPAVLDAFEGARKALSAAERVAALKRIEEVLETLMNPPLNSSDEDSDAESEEWAPSLPSPADSAEDVASPAVLLRRAAPPIESKLNALQDNSKQGENLRFVASRLSVMMHRMSGPAPPPLSPSKTLVSAEYEDPMASDQTARSSPKSSPRGRMKITRPEMSRDRALRPPIA